MTILLNFSLLVCLFVKMIHSNTSYYPRSTTDVWKGYFYKHQVDFFGSRRCLQIPGFDSYFAPIIKFIRPDYYQCFLSNRDIMVFFGQLTVFLSLDLFCCYGCRACFFGTSQQITCSQSVFASVVPHQDQPIFPCQLWKKSISPWASKMMPAVATKLAPEPEATKNAGPDLWKVTICPHNHLFRLIPHGGWWGIKLATVTQAKPGWHVRVEFVMRTSRHEINHVEAERQTQIVGLQALDSGTGSGWPLQQLFDTAGWEVCCACRVWLPHHTCTANIKQSSQQCWSFDA